MNQARPLRQKNKRKRNSIPNNFEELWQKRFSDFINEVGKYGRLIFNDHFSIILLVLFGFGFMYYRDLAQFVNNSPKELITWPIRGIAFVLLWSVMQIGRPLWLTQDPDKAYLFPQGNAWRSYWFKGTLVAAIIPMILIAIILGLIFPFITQATPWMNNQLLIFTVILGLGKLMMLLQVYLNVLQVNKVEGIYSQAPLLLLLLALLLLPAPWHLHIPILITCLWGGVLLFQLFKNQHQTIQFDDVVTQENQRVTNFYKVVSAFADVPQLVPPVKRRAGLDKVIESSGFLNENRYSYLYLRTLVRHTAYSGIWLRILFFMSVLLIFIQTPWLGILLGILGHLMTLIQLLPMVKIDQQIPFQVIYPVQSDKIPPFVATVRIILYLQSLVYCLVSKNLLAGIIWIVIAELLLRVYVPWSIKRKKSGF